MDDDALGEALRAFASSPDNEQAAIESALRASLSRIRAVVECADSATSMDARHGEPNICIPLSVFSAICAAAHSLTPDDRRLLGMEP